MRIIFILPGRGGGGGAHSVVQEAIALRRMGLDVAVASSTGERAAFKATYPELESSGVRNPVFADAAELRAELAGHQLAIATTAPSAILLAEALAAAPADARPKPGYYVQDYEPLFFRPGTAEWRSAQASYTALPGALLIAKTDWLCSIVNANHNVPVVRVQASIDHGAYYPDLQDRKGVAIAAMLRPKTPRRAPRRTARLLARIANEVGEEVQITTFGCDRTELEREGLVLSPAIKHLGVLSRKEVASVLRASDLFLDLSDYQAFGRTGLEGMACGCVPVLPVFGGTGEYARHRENAFLVDTRDDDSVLSIMREYLADAPDIRSRMRLNALETAQNYSIHRAALSEYAAFKAFLN